MKILLACSAGMSTSLLVTRMDEAASKMQVNAQIRAVPIQQAEEMLEDWDVILLGPQVRFQFSRFKGLTQKPVAVIDMRDYGMMNGEKVLKTAIELLQS